MTFLNQNKDTKQPQIVDMLKPDRVLHRISTEIDLHDKVFYSISPKIEKNIQDAKHD